MFAPSEGTGEPFLRVQLDHVGLAKEQGDALVRAASEGAGIPAERVLLTFSHSHSAGFLVPDRMELPGGELIAVYLDGLGGTVRDLAREALADLGEVVIAYGQGRCDLAANRDYWDAERGLHACGYNPEKKADDTVMVARVTGAGGSPIAVFVNYACHPTTLAWENSLLSPDFPGAMREVVERELGVPCNFLQGACGDLGPRHGFVGDTAVADRNGRQLGFAALGVLTALDPPEHDFAYRGPVVSGATLGPWLPEEQSPERVSETRRFAGSTGTTWLPLKALPTLPELREEYARHLTEQAAADARGDVVVARDAGARAERARRWMGRVRGMEGVARDGCFPVGYSAFRLGDAVWVTTGGEPYSDIQVELRRRYPEHPLLFSPLDGALQIAYLLPRDRYGRGLYQEEPSPLAPGCLELLTDAVSDAVGKLLQAS
jgi:hypothetical protein